MRTPEHVRAFIKAHNLPAQVLEFDAPTRTTEEAARVVGVPVGQIVKTLVFVVRGEPYLVLASGATRVDYRALARVLGVSRKRVRLARPDEVLTWTEYPVGAVPPIALPRAFPTLMDERLLQWEAVYAGGGAAHALLFIPVKVLQEVTGAQVTRLHRENETPG